MIRKKILDIDTWWDFMISHGAYGLTQYTGERSKKDDTLRNNFVLSGHNLAGTNRFVVFEKRRQVRYSI